MTENEAIRCLKTQIKIQHCGNVALALEKAIQAIEENQQYHAVGTVMQVEALKKLCELQEALLKQYQSIGTIEELQALKEKAEPKKPRENDGCTCPKCMTFNEVFAKRRNTVKEDVVYCWHCGQAIKLDWS